MRTALSAALLGRILNAEVEDVISLHLVGYRDYGALLATPWGQFAKSRLEFASLFSRRCPRTLHKCSTQVRVTLGRLAPFLYSGALPVSWTQSGPTRHFLSCWKSRQIHTRLCQNTCCGQLAYSRDSLKQQERSCKWRPLHALQDLTVHLFNFFLKAS